MMSNIDRTKRISDIEPIEEATATIEQKQDLDKYIEEPLLEPIRRLYDLNINTLMCSANKKDVGRNAYIDIEYDTLSEENKSTLDLLIANFPNKFQKGRMHGSKQINSIKILMPISSETTAGEVTDYFNNATQVLQIQDVSMGISNKEDLKYHVATIMGCKPEEVAGILDCSEDKLLEECASILGVSEHNGSYYTEEALRRHLVYTNSKKNKQEHMLEKDN